MTGPRRGAPIRSRTRDLKSAHVPQQGGRTFDAEMRSTTGDHGRMRVRGRMFNRARNTKYVSGVDDAKR